MLQKLERLATGRLTLVGLGLIVVCQVLMAACLLPGVQSRRPDAVANGALVMVDFQPLAAPEAQYRVLNLYSADVLGLVKAFYAVDFLLPVAMLLFFLGLYGVLLRRLGLEGRWQWLLVLPLLGLPFDYAENALALTMLARLPEQLPTLATITGVVTAVKLACYGTVMVTCVGLAVAAGLARLRGRAPAPS
jgi:hypothetical protein